MSDFEKLKQQVENSVRSSNVQNLEIEFGKRELIDVEDVKLKASEDQKKQGIKTSSGESPSERLITTAIHREYLYSMLGLILGLVAIIGGVVLGLNGVAGSTSWTANVLSLKSQVNDATPGVVLFIVGVFMVLITKPRVRMRGIRDE